MGVVDWVSIACHWLVVDNSLGAGDLLVGNTSWVLGVQCRLDVGCSQRGYVPAGEAARLSEEVSTANAQIEQMHADLQAWEQAVASRDTELRNLQVGLPPTYELGHLCLNLAGNAKFALSLQLGTEHSKLDGFSRQGESALLGELFVFCSLAGLLCMRWWWWWLIKLA